MFVGAGGEGEGNKIPLPRFCTVLTQPLQFHVPGSHKTSSINNHEKVEAQGSQSLPFTSEMLSINIMESGKRKLSV